MAIMFKVGNTDFSNHVIAGTYSVQKNDLYTSWTDGNYKEHREVTRSQVSGSFDLLFTDITSYESFTQVLATSKQADTSYPIVVFDNISNSELTINAYLEFKTTRSRKDNWDDVIEQFTIEITEK